VQVGKEIESDHGVLEVLDEQLGVQAVEQSLQQAQVNLVGAPRQQVQVEVQGGRLPPNPRHPHLGRVAEVDLQVHVVQLVHCTLQEAAAEDAAPLPGHSVRSSHWPAPRSHPTCCLCSCCCTTHTSAMA